MLSSEQILETAAQGGQIDLNEWPRVLEDLLRRLHDIVHNEFPIPSLPLSSSRPTLIDPEVVASTPPSLPANESTQDQSHTDTDAEPTTNSQDSAKENDTPADIAFAKRERNKRPAQPNAPLDVTNSQRTEEMPSPHMDVEPDPGTLPPELLSLYQTSTRILQNDFADSPPYTIQRLSEMVLHPKRHYRFLPAYLRAVDRIVSVSSPISDFPLPILHASSNGGFLTNGEVPVNGISERDSLGSDESLGGALLTPIPWLVNQNNVLNPGSGEPGADGELYSEVSDPLDGPHHSSSLEPLSTTTTNGAPTNTLAPTSQQPHSSPITSPTLSEQSDASTSSASSTEAQLREQGGVTQGELLRQEQEAGVVPVDSSGHPMTPRRQILSAGAALAVGREPQPLTSTSPSINNPSVVVVPSSNTHHNPSSSSSTAETASSAPTGTADDEIPHARGPATIGMEDMGPQQPSTSGSGSGGSSSSAALGGPPLTAETLDVEAAVGRGRSRSPQPPAGEEGEGKGDGMEGVTGGGAEDGKGEGEGGGKGKGRGEQAKDADGDIVIGDAEGEGGS